MLLPRRQLRQFGAHGRVSERELLSGSWPHQSGHAYADGGGSAAAKNESKTETGLSTNRSLYSFTDKTKGAPPRAKIQNSALRRLFGLGGRWAGSQLNGP